MTTSQQSSFGRASFRWLSTDIQVCDVRRLPTWLECPVLAALFGRRWSNRRCRLLEVERKSSVHAQTDAIDPNETMDAWKEGGAPRCRAGLEYLTPSAVAGPPLLIWINAGALVLGARWFI
jgi:hypothetical protein